MLVDGRECVRSVIFLSYNVRRVSHTIGIHSRVLLYSDQTEGEKRDRPPKLKNYAQQSEQKRPRGRPPKQLPTEEEVLATKEPGQLRERRRVPYSENIDRLIANGLVIVKRMLTLHRIP